MESKIESLEESAKQADSTSAGFMQPEVPVQKGKPGRKPDTPEQKAEKARLKAEQQKRNASGVKSPGPEPSINQGPSQASQTQPQNGPSGKEIAKNFMPMISTATAQWVGDPRAQMTPDEIDACATGIGMMMDKYMPVLSDKYLAEATFLMAFGGYGLRTFSMKRQIELAKFKQSQAFVNNPPAPERQVNNYEPKEGRETTQ